jgi:FkbM family methyltransferase
MEQAAVRAPSVFSNLGIKHRIATSVLAGPVAMLRSNFRMLRALRHPELALLYKEDSMIDAVLARYIQPEWNCLDVGAHLGSVFFRLTQLAPAGRHAMIEASPSKAQMLRDRFGEDRVHQVAVSDTDGAQAFFENIDQPGFSSLANRKSRGRVVEYSVNVRRIDSLLAPNAKIDFLKVDVEGFEYPALRGAEALLARCRPLILFEAGAVSDPDIDTDTSAALFKWLTQSQGYHIYSALDLYYNRPPITLQEFDRYRSYPFMAFNFFALCPTRQT